MIAAHGGSMGLFVYEGYAKTLFALLARYPHLFATARRCSSPTGSACCAASGRQACCRGSPSGPTTRSRAFPAILLARLDPRRWLAVRRETNYFDRQVALFRALGWEPTSGPFERLVCLRRGAGGPGDASGTYPIPGATGSGGAMTGSIRATDRSGRS